MPDAKTWFNNGAVYEETMGRWSRLAGEIFLTWLAPAPGLRWIDVGCGNGAFTALLMQHCAPVETCGIDPSEAQIAFARSRPDAAGAAFQTGDAMALPFPDSRFDAAAMALAISFLADPARSVAEMARVVRRGGAVATYMWDGTNGGSPFHPIQAEIREQGIPAPTPPSANASRMEALRALWTGTGLEAVDTKEITVRRTFADFDTFWSVSTQMGNIQPVLAAMAPDGLASLKERVRMRVPADAEGRITYAARANAIKGRVPG
jgi:SAM-dependent methyltransferase